MSSSTGTESDLVGKPGLDPTDKANKMKMYGLVAALLAGAIIWLLPTGLTPAGKVSLAITVCAIVLWILEVFPIEVTAILLSTFFVVLGAAPTTVAFSGYANENVWFIFAALVFGLAVDYSGIGKRLAFGLMRYAGTSFKSMMVIVVVVGFLFSFLTPAGVERLLIIYPIAIGIASAFVKGPVKGTNTGKLAMAFTFLAGNTFGFGLLTGIAVNVLGIGVIKQMLGVDIYWSQWITWFGVPALLSTLISLALMWKIFPPEPYVVSARQELSEQFQNRGPMTSVEKRAALYLAITLVLWMTDRWHHIPSWAVAIFSAGLFCAPGIGIIGREQLKKLQFPIVIFSGAVISLGAVLGKTGVATWMGKALFGSFIKAGMSSQVTGAITFAVMAVARLPFADNKGAVAAFTPAVIGFFKTMGINPLGPALISIFGGDTIAFFPYMSMPFMAIMGLGYLGLKDSVKLLATYSFVALAINILACFTWYHWVGLL